MMIYGMDIDFDEDVSIQQFMNRASDVREFIKKRFDVGTLRKFEKEHGTDK